MGIKSGSAQGAEQIMDPGNKSAFIVETLLIEAIFFNRCYINLKLSV